MAEKLKDYRNKRNFAVTGEPSGIEKQTRGKKKKLIFAVQYHLARREHYDLRLEWNGVLLSWAVPKGPSYDPRDKRLAVKVEDHPLDYADFEGTIPKGEYGGGTVMLWDEGEWTPQTDVDKGLESGSLKLELNGKRLKGKWALVRLGGENAEDADNWLLIKENDGFKKRTAGISAFRTGIRSGLTVHGIEKQDALEKKKNPFQSTGIQLAKLVDAIPEGDEWLFEVKFDGYRIIAFSEDGKTRLISRNGHDFTPKFKNAAEAISKWLDGRAAVLDGEMVVADQNGKTDFQALQRFIKHPDGNRLVFMVFDLLALDGKDLRDLPLLQRKEKLGALIKDAPDEIKLSKYVAGNGRQSYAAAERLGLEGIVGKRADSPYAGIRNGDWIKIKCYRRQEFIVCGYTRTEKKTDGVSALLLGVYDSGKLVYAGRAGTGMDRRDMADLEKEFSKIRSDKSPYSSPPPLKRTEKTFWLKARLVAEVQFAEWTDENVLRQASFKGLRYDKKPEEVIMEKPEKPKEAKAPRNATAGKIGSNALKKPKKTVKDIEVCGVSISNPDKIVFKNPEIKKLDVIEYYRKVARRMLKYAGGRVLSVVRCHKGISSECFFKKHPAADSKNVSVVSVVNSDGVSGDYFYVDDIKGLISEAQMGSLEFHIWGSKAQTLEKPDMMVFDLDPDQGMELEQIRQGVRDLKSILDKLHLKSFLKTSGGKGYHVVVPFRPSADWTYFHDFAKHIARIMEERWPDRYTSNIRKNKRQGKIFIDWARNGRGATSVAPYSLRARPGARVSMPIAWSELNSVAPDGVDIYGALERLSKSDPWKNFTNVDQQLKI